MIANKAGNLPVQGRVEWWEDDLPETLEAPVEAPVGFVEALPVEPRRRRRRKPKRDVVKMGWGSERLNRRTKR